MTATCKHPEVRVERDVNTPFGTRRIAVHGRTAAHAEEGARAIAKAMETHAFWIPLAEALEKNPDLLSATNSPSPPPPEKTP